jgi:hypothetical protein
VRVNLELRSPLRFRLDNLHAPGQLATVTTTDLRQIQAGTATIRVWNRLPVGGHAYLVAARDSSHVLAGSGARVDTVAQIDVPVPPISNGRANSPTYAEATVVLTDSLLELFRNPPFYTRTDVTVPGAGDSILLAHASDWLKVQVIADVTYRMETEAKP